MSLQHFLESIGEPEAANDTYLQDSFVVTDQIARLSDIKGKEFIAVGMKGSGKSACFQYLTKWRVGDDAVIVPITAENQDVEQGDGGIPTRRAVAALRRDLVFQALDSASKSPKFGKLPRDIQGNAKGSLKKFFDALKEKVGGGGVSILGCGFTINKATSKVSSLSLTSSQDNSEAEAVLRQVCEKIPIFLVVDDPESIFSGGQDLNRTLVAALCIAANDLVSSIVNFKVAILIKPNVLDEIELIDEFVNISTSKIFRLTWTNEELYNVIRRRATSSEYTIDGYYPGPESETFKQVCKYLRTGPRELMNLTRLCMTISDVPEQFPSAIARSLTAHREFCRLQLRGAYERQYPGLLQFVSDLDKVKMKFSIDSLSMDLEKAAGTKNSLREVKNKEYFKGFESIARLLKDLGLVAFEISGDLALPYKSKYYQETELFGARVKGLPCLSGG